MENMLGTHWEFGEHNENLMITHWELKGTLLEKWGVVH
jgi:hypothetical protein